MGGVARCARPVLTLLSLVALLPLVSGCSSDLAVPDASPSPSVVPGASTVPADADAGFSARVVLTRQRDLVDRGLVNVFTRNSTGADVIVRSRGLELSAFAAPAPVQRRSPIGDGAEVALQIAFGDVTDCTSPDPVSGTVELAYTLGDDDTLHTASVPLTDAKVLDDIRANVCTARLVEDAADVSLRDATSTGETVTATLSIDRRSGGPDLQVRSLGGTVLFGVQAVDETDLPIELGTEPASVEVPIVITVNRCDPHALAETTKRYAVDLRVSVDGAAPRKVGLDVTVLEPLMEQALQACRVRNGDA